MWNYFVFLVLFYYVSSQNTDDCRCVTYTLCRATEGTIITDGEGVIDERLGNICPSCNCTVPEICCSLTGNVTTIRAANNNNVKACGYRNPNGVGFKIGDDDNDASFGEFPWMVAILENGKYQCGGSLIHPSVVLTAAHCIKRDNYTVRAGEWDSSSTNENKKHQDRSVVTIKKHEKFNPRNYFNDVALLFLKDPVSLDVHINFACLTPKTVVDTGRCYAMGWGKSRFGPNEELAAILKKIELPMVNRKTCQENLRKTRLGEYFKLDQSFVCAGGEKGKDVCTGDGGGPLVCPIEEEEERYQQVGIVAWGIGCSDENVPGVFTNVAHLRDWIDKQMTDNNLETRFYQF